MFSVVFIIVGIICIAFCKLIEYKIFSLSIDKNMDEGKYIFRTIFFLIKSIKNKNFRNKYGYLPLCNLIVLIVGIFILIIGLINL